MRLRSSCFLMVALTIAGSDLACAQDADCNVHRGEFVNGGQSQGKMVVVNKGKGCAFTFKFQGTFDPDEWSIVEPPKHGKVETAGSVATYLPEAGYSGADAFVVEVSGRNPMGKGKSRNGRLAFEVEVRAPQ